MEQARRMVMWKLAAIVVIVAACGPTPVPPSPPVPQPEEPVSPAPSPADRLTRVAPGASSCWSEQPCPGGAAQLCLSEDTAVFHDLCGAPGCHERAASPPCTATAPCREDQSCAVRAQEAPGGGRLRCDTTACDRDDQCRSTNLRCEIGRCVRRSCDSDAACDGYCLGAKCFARPGFCVSSEPGPPRP